MPIVFTPYLKRVAGRDTDDEEQRGDEEASDGLSKRRLAVGAAVAAVGAAYAAWRLQRTQQFEERRRQVQQADANESDGQLRRVGKGWIRR
ncbi:hypothetical protein ABSL23_12985 [Halobacterium sp. NMX12-1]|uniref:Uncharacterized protein n=1 Tax=Halobacterium sp. NMX12-1 TaxID=3166650 RepID=A0AAU8CB93_9EURY